MFLSFCVIYAPAIHNSTKHIHFPIWISYWNLSSYIPVAPFLDRMEFLRPDLNFFHRPGFPRNLWKPAHVIGFLIENVITFDIKYLGVKDTKSVISLNFLRGAGLKCPINHYEWMTPVSTNKKITNFTNYTHLWKVICGYGRGSPQCGCRQTGQKAIDCRCYRLPTYPLPRSQIFSTAHTTNF